MTLLAILVVFCLGAAIFYAVFEQNWRVVSALVALATIGGTEIWVIARIIEVGATLTR